MRNDRRAHDIRPKNHIRKVHTGRVGSSLLVTVSRTCSMGDMSSSSMVVAPMAFSASEFLSLVAATAAEVAYGVSISRDPIVGTWERGRGGG